MRSRVDSVAGRSTVSSAPVGEAGLSIDDIADLYRRYGASVLHRCRQIVFDEEEAWDAMHRTFIKAIRYRKSFKKECSPLTWLYSIAFRTSYDKCRELRRRKEAGTFVPFDDGSILIESNIEDGVIQNENVARLMIHFNRQVQEIVVLRYFDELELPEIAKRTGLSRRTVARRLKTFLERSRKIIEGSSP